MKRYFVYILKCKNNELYAGFTSSFKKRVREHRSGNGCLYTKNRRPVKLVYFEVWPEFTKAKLRENQIKDWRREKKENLIKYGKPIL